jgi:hypothetical protein
LNFLATGLFLLDNHQYLCIKTSNIYIHFVMRHRVRLRISLNKCNQNQKKCNGSDLSLSDQDSNLRPLNLSFGALSTGLTTSDYICLIVMLRSPKICFLLRDIYDPDSFCHSRNVYFMNEIHEMKDILYISVWNCLNKRNTCFVSK